GRLPVGAHHPMTRARIRRLGWRLKRALAGAWVTAVLVGAAAMLRRGAFTDLRDASAGLLPIGIAAALGLSILLRLALRLRPPEALPRWKAGRTRDEEARTARADVELGAALFVATYVIIAMTGGL